MLRVLPYMLCGVALVGRASVGGFGWMMMVFFLAVGGVAVLTRACVRAALTRCNYVVSRHVCVTVPRDCVCVCVCFLH